MIARMADQLEWEPYKMTFKYLLQNGYNQGGNKYDKFVYFINTLSRCATEYHGREINAMRYFSPMEIESIKKQLQ